MKNLKKVLALVVSLTMVLGTVAFAFTDVDVENDAYTAVQTLSSLGILNGYEDGTFGPEKDITRAEFAAVVCRALGLESSANGAKGATMFTDVSADHWAAGYINLAAGASIINGMGDGTFQPESNVTYEQAVTMLVRALGFEPLAAQKGGFPTGYLVVANTYGMTEDVNVSNEATAANRGVVAQLTYNALDIPMMEQTGFGSNLNYEVQDGQNNRGYKTLLTGLDIAKLGGVVTATSVIGGVALEADEVEYKINDCFDDVEWEKVVFGDYNTIGNPTQYFTLAEGIYADEYFGIASEIFARNIRSNDWEIIAIMPGEDSEIIELEAGDIDSWTEGQIEYYVDINATKTTKVKIEDKLDADGNELLGIYYNNAIATAEWKADNDGNYGIYINGASSAVNDDAKIQIINNDADSKFDMIMIKDYAYDVVKTVEADRDRFNSKNNTGRFTFDFDDETVINTIVNKDGEEIAIADFAEGDVFAWISSNGKSSGFDWIEIINYGQNAVQGAVTEVEADGTKVAIDGVTYELYSTLDSTINATDEGTFFLTADNKIFLVDTTTATAKDYGYILQVGESKDTFSTGLQVKMLTIDGSIVTFDTKDKFKAGKDTVNMTADAKWRDTFLGELVEIVKYDPDPDDGKEEEKEKEVQKGVQEEVANRLVTYKLDSNDKIREINVVDAKNTGAINGVFAKNADSIGNVILEDDTVIFDITSADIEDANVASISTLVDETKYVGTYAANKDGDVVVCVITEGVGSIDLAQDLAIVESVGKVSDGNNGTIMQIKYYTAADETLKTLLVDEDDDVLEWVGDGDNADIDYEDIEKGAVIIFTEGANNYAKKLAVVAKADADHITADVKAKYDVATDDYGIVLGYIGDIKNDNKTRIFYNAVGAKFDDENPGTALVLSSNVYGYTYNNNNSDRIIIKVDDWAYTASVDVPNVTEDKATATFFVAKTTNGIATDIMTYSIQREIEIK